MGSIHNAHNKSTGHIEFSSDAEDEADEFHQDCSYGSSISSGSSRTTGSSSSGSSSSSSSANTSISSVEGLPVQVGRGQRESRCHNASSGGNAPGTQLRRLVSVEVDKEDIKASPSPSSPTSVIPVMDASSVSVVGTESASSPKKQFKVPSPRTARRKPANKLRKANSIGTLLVSNTPQPKEASPTSTRSRKFGESVQKSKSMRSLQVNPGFTDDHQEQVSLSRDKRSQRGVKKAGSLRSIYSSKGSRSGSRRANDNAASLDSDGPRRSGRGVRKCRSGCDGANPHSTKPRRGGQSSVGKNLSMRDLNATGDDLGAASSIRSSSSRPKRGTRKSKSMRSLNANTTNDYPKPAIDKDIASTDVQRSSKVATTGASAATGKRSTATYASAATTSLRTKGSLQPSKTPPATTKRRGPTRNSSQKVTRSRSMRSFHASKEESTCSVASGGGNQSASKKDALRRSKSTSRLDIDVTTVRRTTSSRSRTSLARNEDSNSFVGTISLSKLTDEKWQRRRSKSRSRDSASNSSESQTNDFARRSRSRTGKANGNSLHSSSPNLGMDFDAVEHDENLKPVEKNGRKTRKRASMGCCESTKPNQPDAQEASKQSEQVMNRARSRSKQASRNRGLHASSTNLNENITDGKCEHQNRAENKSEKLSEQDNKPTLPARKRSSKSSSRFQIKDTGSKDDGSTPKGSTVGADTGESVNGSPRVCNRGRAKKSQTEKQKRKRSKSLKGLKDLRTKLGHSSGPMLSPKGCNLSVTSGSISSLTMSSRMFSHDDHSLASSQRSPYHRAYSTPKLFVAGELSSSLLVEGDGDETTEEQTENRGSRWSSLPQSKERNSMDVLPVAPVHDVSSCAGVVPDSPNLICASKGSKCSVDNNQGKPVEDDACSVPPDQVTPSRCRLPALHTPSQSVHSNMGWISELTPGTFISPAPGDATYKSKGNACGESSNSQNRRDFFASFSNLLLEDGEKGWQENSPNRKKDSIPRRARRHSFGSVASVATSQQSGPGKLKGGSGLSAALMQLDGENDNAPKKPARRTSTGSSVQYISSH